MRGVSSSRGGLSYDVGVAAYCGDEGIQAVATAIDRLRDSAPEYMRSLVLTARDARYDRVFDAALGLAAASGLPPQVREAALVIMANHLMPNLHYGVDQEGRCLGGGFTEVTDHGQLSPDRPPQFLTLLDTLIRDRTLATPMRKFVRCVAVQVGYYDLPLDVRPDDLHIEVVCGYRIRVRNDAPDDAVLEIREDLSGRTRKVHILAGAVEEFPTSIPEGSSIYAGGPVYVSLRGEEVWRGVTTGWQWWCPQS